MPTVHDLRQTQITDYPWTAGANQMKIASKLSSRQGGGDSRHAITKLGLVIEDKTPDGKYYLVKIEVGWEEIAGPIVTRFKKDGVVRIMQWNHASYPTIDIIYPHN